MAIQKLITRKQEGAKFRYSYHPRCQDAVEIWILGLAGLFHFWLWFNSIYAFYIKRNCPFFVVFSVGYVGLCLKDWIGRISSETAQSARFSCRHISQDGSLAGTYGLNQCILSLWMTIRYHRNSSNRYHNFKCICKLLSNNEICFL